MNINELKQQKAERKAAAEKLINAAITNGKDLAGADLEQYQGHIEAIKNVDSLLARHAELATFTASPVDPSLPNLQPGAVKNAEVLAAFDKYLRTGIQAVTSGLNVGTATEGGAGVPKELHPVLIEKKRDSNVVRRLANVISASHDRTFVFTDADATAAWTAEEAAFNASKPTLKSSEIKNYKGTCIVKVSEELLLDSIFDVPGYVVGQGGNALGVLEESGFLVGTGTTMPSGIVPAATAGVTTASPTAITGDEIITHYHKLRAVYRNQATWLMPDAVALMIRLLKNSVTGDYIWQPGLQAGQPDRLLGRPVEYSENMPAATATKRPVLFGDFKQVTIVDRLNATIQRLNELYAATGQVGFRFQMRTDGALLVPEAMQAIVMHA